MKLHSSREGAARAREARAGRGGDAAAAQMARGGAGAAPAGAPARSAELVAAYTAEAAQTRAQRCACGKSKRFPLCDGAHEGFGWSCVRRKFTRLGFAADTVNQNVASRLAHQHRGALCLLPSDPLAAAPAHNSVETLMLVLDGSELAFLTELAGKANAERIVVISLGVAPRLLAPSFAAAAGRGLSVACVDLSAVAHDVSLVFRRISDVRRCQRARPPAPRGNTGKARPSPPLSLSAVYVYVRACARACMCCVRAWQIARDGVAGLPQDIRNNVFELPSLHSASLDASEVVASAALAGSPGAAEDAAPAPATPQAPPLPRVFVSHAVSDEAVILPVVDRLRALYGLEAFVCADSIADGADWAGAIAAALEASDCFLLLLSAAVRRSHFCSFEVGYAVGKGVPLRIISLDGTLPPAFVQHVHMR